MVPRCHSRLVLLCIAILSSEALGAQARETQLHYALRLVSADPPRIEASLEFSGDADGSTALLHPSGVRGPNTGESFASVAATTLDGVALAIDRSDPQRFVFTHPPDSRIRVTWELEHALLPPAGQPGTDYRTVLEKERFHALGNHLFLAPEPTESKAKIDFEWRGFEEAGWRTVCSHGVGSGPFRFEGDPGLFRHSIFMAGDLAIETRDVPGGNLVTAIARIEEFDLEAVEVADLAARIVRFEREFMRDETGSFYLITMTPQGPARASGGLALGGTGLLDSFALFVSPGMSLSRTNGDFDRFCHLLAHEHFHEWNGLRIRRASPEGETYWFSEGFTEFFTRRILFRAGLVSREASLEDFNRSLQGYWSNPYRNVKNQRIAAEFFTNMPLSFVPYRRGDLAAARLDDEIRRKSAGEYALEDLFRELLTAAREQKAEVTTETLLSAFERWTDPVVAAHLRDVLVDGADPIFPDDFLASELTRDWIEITPADPGFDVMATVHSNVVHGVVEGGKAHAAGLRDGLKVLGLAYDSSLPERPIPLRVEIDGSVKEIVVDPRGEPVRAPRYSLRTDSGPAEPPSFP